MPRSRRECHKPRGRQPPEAARPSNVRESLWWTDSVELRSTMTAEGRLHVAGYNSLSSSRVIAVECNSQRREHHRSREKC
jgi:hypothetical protein